MGSKGYERSREEWISQGRLPPHSSDSSTPDSGSFGVGNRAYEWILAREQRTKDGQWAVHPSRKETVQVVNKLVRIVLIQSGLHIILNVFSIM